jgi:TonB family protein
VTRTSVRARARWPAVTVDAGRRAGPIVAAILALGCGRASHRPWVPPEAEARIYSEDGVEQPPQLLRMPSPEYPPDLLRRQVPGRVELAYVVGPDGRVEPASIRVVSTTHGDFARAAVAAVREAEYEPGVQAGARVRVRLKHVLQFRVRPH